MQEEDADFIYLALERCFGTLTDLVEKDTATTRYYRSCQLPPLPPIPGASHPSRKNATDRERESKEGRTVVVAGPELMKILQDMVSLSA